MTDKGQTESIKGECPRCGKKYKRLKDLEHHLNGIKVDVTDWRGIWAMRPCEGPRKWRKVAKKVSWT